MKPFIYCGCRAFQPNGAFGALGAHGAFCTHPPLSELQARCTAQDDDGAECEVMSARGHEKFSLILLEMSEKITNFVIKS